jgi:hypothetical protein
MKNNKNFIMALLCLIMSNISFAQTQEEDSLLSNIYEYQSFTEGFDSLFNAVSKTYITTGILYNRVAPLANIPMYNDSTKFNCIAMPKISLSILFYFR